MKVSDFQKGRARSTEAAFERRFVKALTSAGVWSRHMADRYSGLPDRYVEGARWIEFKSIMRKRGGFLVGEGMSDEQRRCARELTEHGEKVWLCSLLDIGDWSRIAFLSFKVVDDRWGTLIPASLLLPDSCGLIVSEYL